MIAVTLDYIQKGNRKTLINDLCINDLIIFHVVSQSIIIGIICAYVRLLKSLNV